MSYTGKPISLIRNGKKSTAYGLTESMRYTIGPPGCLPLNNLHFSLVDVPDLQLLPDAYPQLDSIWMGVGPVPEFLHRMLNGLAWLVKKGIIPSLRPTHHLSIRSSTFCAGVSIAAVCSSPLKEPMLTVE